MMPAPICISHELRVKGEYKQSKGSKRASFGSCLGKNSLFQKYWGFFGFFVIGFSIWIKELGFF